MRWLCVLLVLIPFAAAAETYRIYRDGVQVGTSATLTYQDAGLSPATTYTYTVTAVDDVTGLESAHSAAYQVTTQSPPPPPPEPPAAPVNVQGSSTTETVSLSWESGLPPEPPPPPPSNTAILFEDWSNLRMNNGLSPPEPLFQPYPRGTGSMSQALIPDGIRVTVNSGNNIDWMFFPYPYVYPSGFAQGRIEQGQTWRNDVNRLTFWVRCSHTYTVNGENDLSVGNYVKPITNTGANDQGAHYYWLLGSTTFHANRWTKIVLTPKVQASNFSPGSTEFPPDPDFFSELTRFYFGDNHSRTIPNGSTWDFSPFVFDTVAGEPDANVATVTGTYSGTRYEVTFSGRKNVNQTLDVRYSTSTMKPNNFASGTSGGTVNTTGDDYTRIRWNSPAMPEADNLYVAIRPQGMAEFHEIHLPRR